MSGKSELRRSVVAMIVFLAVIALYLLVKVPVKTTVKQDVPLDIYENGVVVGETAVHMDGTYCSFLIETEDRFNGRFEIEVADRTCHVYSTASITWPKDREWQTILYFNSGDAFIKEFGLNYIILINPDMTEMAIQLTDGRVLASSETMYRIYVEHFDYDTEKDVTDIIGGIPEF